MSDSIDLHGFTAAEAIAEFVKYYNQRVLHGNKYKIEVIHGYGSTGTGGVLRGRLRSFFIRNAECLSFETGEGPYGGNPGVTYVFPGKALPDILDSLSEEILEYCTSPRPITKISGKFRRYGSEQIKEAMRKLEKQGALAVVYKGGLKHYRSSEG